MSDHEMLGIPQAPVASSLSEIARLRRERVAARHLDVPVPGYGGALSLRFRAPTDEQLARYRKQAQERSAQGDIGRELYQCDFLAMCCETLLDGDGRPAGSLDEAAAAALDVPWTSPAGLVRELFTLAPQRRLAIETVGVLVERWLVSGDSEAAEELSPNSPGAVT